MAEPDGHPLVVDGYGSGAPGTAKLNQAIEVAWRDVLADPDSRREAAAILGIEPDELAKHFPVSPYEAEPNEAGFGPVEAAILVFVGNVAYDVAKGLAKKGVDAALSAMWKKVIRPKVEGLLPWGALDGNKPVDRKGQDDA
jgi:hypothetical protein